MLKQLVIAANAKVFELKKGSYKWDNGDIVMSYVFAPVANPKGGVFTGFGFDVKRGWGLPTNALTLILRSDCKGQDFLSWTALKKGHTIGKDSGNTGNDPAGRVNNYGTKERYGPQEDGAFSG